MLGMPLRPGAAHVMLLGAVRIEHRLWRSPGRVGEIGGEALPLVRVSNAANGLFPMTLSGQLSQMPVSPPTSADRM